MPSLLKGRGNQFAPGWDDKVSFQESLKVLRSNMTVALGDIHQPSVFFTSPNAHEGKTLLCANLAASFVMAGYKVVLVDLDLRHPNMHRLVRAHNHQGATEVLTGARGLDEAMQYIELGGPKAGRSGMYFLSTGSEVENPAELLGSGRAARLLDGLAAQADIVVIDTPPVLPVADTLVIGRLASGGVLVAEAGETTVTSLQKAKDLLIRNQTRLFGCVLNKFQGEDAEFGYGHRPETSRGDGQVNNAKRLVGISEADADRG